jgi:hypothetical protein
MNLLPPFSGQKSIMKMEAARSSKMVNFLPDHMVSHPENSSNTQDIHISSDTEHICTCLLLNVITKKVSVKIQTHGLDWKVNEEA